MLQLLIDVSVPFFYSRQKNASLKEQKKTKTSGLDGQKKVAGKLNENNKEVSTEGKCHLCVGCS